MAKWLTAGIALVVDLSLVPSIHISQLTTTYNSNSKGTETGGSTGIYTHVHIETRAHIHGKNF